MKGGHIVFKCYNYNTTSSSYFLTGIMFFNKLSTGIKWPRLRVSTRAESCNPSRLRPTSSRKAWIYVNTPRTSQKPRIHTPPIRSFFVFLHLFRPRTGPTIAVSSADNPMTLGKHKISADRVSHVLGSQYSRENIFAANARYFIWTLTRQRVHSVRWTYLPECTYNL